MKFNASLLHSVGVYYVRVGRNGLRRRARKVR